MAKTEYQPRGNSSLPYGGAACSVDLFRVIDNTAEGSDRGLSMKFSHILVSKSFLKETNSKTVILSEGYAERKWLRNSSVQINVSIAHNNMSTS